MKGAHCCIERERERERENETNLYVYDYMIMAVPHDMCVGQKTFLSDLPLYLV